MGLLLVFLCDHCSISPTEETWLFSFSLELPKTIDITNLKLEFWEIHMEKLDFIKWVRTYHRHILFFDGASKWNPVEVGGGWILFYPKDLLEFTYSWGIGEDTNNTAKALALWQCLFQMLVHDINDAIVFGDSRLITQDLVTKSLPSQLRLR